MEYVKYPRTSHLPWSECVTSDDKRLDSTEHFAGHEVVVTQKMDGENTAIYSNGYVHARSIDSRNHESRNWIKALAGRIAKDVPNNFRIGGENCYAKHSIHYQALPTYFFVFCIWHNDISLSWDEVEFYSEALGLTTVPVVYKGLWDEQTIKSCYQPESGFGAVSEGFVVRKTASFKVSDHDVSVAKFVRKNHVDENAKHWMHSAIVPNLLAKEN
jgi:hypothetical protein